MELGEGRAYWAKVLCAFCPTFRSLAKWRKWLGFMAKKMEERGLVVFELVDLQYDWWRWWKITKILALQFKAVLSPNAAAGRSCLRRASP